MNECMAAWIAGWMWGCSGKFLLLMYGGVNVFWAVGGAAVWGVCVFGYSSRRCSAMFQTWRELSQAVEAARNGEGEALGKARPQTPALCPSWRNRRCGLRRAALRLAFRGAPHTQANIKPCLPQVDAAPAISLDALPSHCLCANSSRGTARLSINSGATSANAVDAHTGKWRDAPNETHTQKSNGQTQRPHTHRDMYRWRVHRHTVEWRRGGTSGGRWKRGLLHRV
eukprot:GHVT01096773.1.p1 GENE.GHVT01096773.1~~GHVT01096773.1.p1  ORF type:complete len:226 (-),score=23.37 GHVT01096773.1:143-820(-)